MDGVQHNPSVGRLAILPGRSGRLPALGGTDADAEIFDLVVVTEQRPKIEFGAGAGGDVVRTRGPSRLRMDDFAAIVFGVDLEFGCCGFGAVVYQHTLQRSEEHTSELQSLMRISYAVFCLKKKKK